ncbi:hypothetical protein RUND412_000564, partial [Rhizina undulata]
RHNTLPLRTRTREIHCIKHVLPTNFFQPRDRPHQHNHINKFRTVSVPILPHALLPAVVPAPHVRRISKHLLGGIRNILEFAILRFIPAQEHTFLAHAKTHKFRHTPFITTGLRRGHPRRDVPTANRLLPVPRKPRHARGTELERAEPIAVAVQQSEEIQVLRTPLERLAIWRIQRQGILRGAATRGV